MNPFDYRPHLLPKVRSAEIMRSARGMPCTLRIASYVPGLKCSGPETTVVAHMPCGWGKGMSTKVTDMAGAYGCQTCHDIVDGRMSEALDYLFINHGSMVLQRYLSALTETHALMIQQGIIVIPDAEFV